MTAQRRAEVGMMEQDSKASRAAKQTAAMVVGTVPIVIGVLALTSLVTAAVPPQTICDLLPMESLLAPFLGGLVGSIAAGHPVVSYVLAGELQAAGVGLATTTALIVSWVTVGIFHLPVEAAILGARFAIWRNVICFVLAIATGYAVAFLMLVGG